MIKCACNHVQILNAAVHKGQVGLNGVLGYDDLKVSVPVAYRDWNSVSVHAPSALSINVVEPVEIVGFMNGSMRAYREDDILFSINGDAIDALHGPWEATRSLVLAPGQHQLSVTYAGNPEYCHSLWLYRDVAKELATAENTMFVSAAAFGDDFENATRIFRRSAIRFGFPITFVDQDKEFQGYYTHKIKAVGKELRHQKNLGKTFGFLMDCRDIFFLHSIQTVLAKFNAMYEGRLIFNSDFIGETWPVDRIWFWNILQQHKGKSHVSLNAGFIAGKIDDILAVMDKIEEIRAEFFSGAPQHPILSRVYGEQGLHRQEDDQLWYHLCLALYPDLIEIDDQKLLGTFIKDFPRNPPRFSDDPRALDTICKASLVHGAYPSRDSRWEKWTEEMMSKGLF